MALEKLRPEDVNDVPLHHPLLHSSQKIYYSQWNLIKVEQNNLLGIACS